MTGPKVALAPDGSTGDESRELSLLWILAVLLRERRVILACTGVSLILSVTAALLSKPTYTTTFSFIPQSAQDPNGAAGLAGLAGQFGISVGALGGSAQAPQLYADLLVTREVLTPIANDSFAVDGDAGKRVPLHVFLKISKGEPPVLTDNTIRELRKKVISSSVATRTTGMVTVSVRTRSPQVSLGLAQRLLEGLNTFNLTTRQSQAREERRFTEARLRDARAGLRSAEDRLQRFLLTNKQFEGSPQLRFERDTLQREVTFQTQVATSLALQYEEIRIREVRDTPVITVIDRPALPVRKDPQGRLLLVLIGGVAGLLLGVLAALVRNAFAGSSSARRDPGFAKVRSEWNRLRGARAS